MRVLDLLRQVYREIGMLETSRRQKDMIIADNAGVKAIRYDKDKVSGGQQGDLADVLLNIERERERINEQIAGSWNVSCGIGRSCINSWRKCLMVRGRSPYRNIISTVCRGGWWRSGCIMGRIIQGSLPIDV